MLGVQRAVYGGTHIATAFVCPSGACFATTGEYGPIQ